MKTKFLSIDVIFYGSEENQQDGNNKSILLVDHTLPLLEEAHIDMLPAKLMKKNKRLRSQYLRRRKERIIDLIEVIQNPQAQLAIRAELEKAAYKQVIELNNRRLAERPVGETYYSLSYSKASRREKVRLLRQVWSRRKWKLQKAKRQVNFELAFWLTQRHKLASKKRNC